MDDEESRVVPFPLVVVIPFESYNATTTSIVLLLYASSIFVKAGVTHRSSE